MRWKIPLSWLLGAAPLVAMIPAEDLRLRVCICVIGFVFILGSMVLAQDDGFDAHKRRIHLMDGRKPDA